MKPASFTRLGRWSTLAVVVCATVAATATAAHAAPDPTVPTVGWAGDWHFVDSNNWTYSMNLPGVSLTGNGYDTDGVRYFDGTLTDTTPDPNVCARVDIEEGGGLAFYVACDGTITFTQFDPTPGDYTLWLGQRTSVQTNLAWFAMTIPTTQTNPELRGTGYGAHWAYQSPTLVNYAIVRPGAAVNGYATGSSVHNTSAVVSGTSCTTTTIRTNVDVASTHVCASTSPGTVTASNIGRFGVRNCLQSRVLGALPKCVSVSVP